MWPGLSEGAEDHPQGMVTKKMDAPSGVRLGLEMRFGNHNHGW